MTETRTVDGVTFVKTRDLVPYDRASGQLLSTERWDGGVKGGVVVYRGPIAGTNGHNYRAGNVWSKTFEKAAGRAIAEQLLERKRAEAVLAKWEGVK